MIDEKTKIISFVGSSGSGKTTLIVKIVEMLSKAGYKIGTIKHTHHDFEIDKPNKDSYRHFNAGALASMIISENKIGFVKRKEHLHVNYLVDKYFDDCHLVIVEGFKNDDTNKIEVHRKDNNKDFLYKNLKNVVAIACDSDIRINIPVFQLNDIEKICSFIEKNFLKS